VNRHRSAKAPFALACLCILGLATFLGGGAVSAGAADACPNEAVRNAQHATQLGDCRAWEMVSPVDKNGGEAFGNGTNSSASTSGDGLVFSAHGTFADSVGSGVVGLSVYLARRTSGGWLTHAITPASRPDTNQVLGASTTVEVFSDDLSHALTFGYDLPGALDDVPERKSLYVEDTATRALRTVSIFQRPGEEVGKDFPPYPRPEFLNGQEIYGASTDLQHVAWVTAAQLLPTGTAPGYPQPGEPRNVYTWNDGTIHLAGVLPDGTLPPDGSRVEPEGYEGIRGTMSADGSRQTFLASPAAGTPSQLYQLYLRIDNTRTAWITKPENPSFSVSGEPENVHFEGMTPDGKHVFFVTESPLLEADTASGPDLYRWTDSPDPASDDNLTLITDDGSAVNQAGFGAALVGISDDGSRVFVQGIDGVIKLWEEGTGIRTVDPAAPRNPELKEKLTLTATQPGNARVSPDGNWLAYIKGFQMHLYDREGDDLIFVGGGATVVPAMSSGDRYDYVGARPRFLSNDGRVFFSTQAALVPEDVNGVYDAYEFDGRSEELHLLSSGRGSAPAMFADASRSGDDVFFATRQALVSADTDGGALDFYDARVGGGFSEPDPPPAGCFEEACQGALAPTPGPMAAPTARLRGAGNVKAQRRCAKNRRRVRRNGRVRCLKRHNRHRRDAGTDRGGRRK
jgi:hypothetical protein